MAAPLWLMKSFGSHTSGRRGTDSLVQEEYDSRQKDLPDLYPLHSAPLISRSAQSPSHLLSFLLNHLPLISHSQLSLRCDDLDHQLSNLAGIWHKKKDTTPSPKHRLLAPSILYHPFLAQSILLLLLSE